jgi:NAD(P)-dependent dehydrogenase (short-subunit alcohol dehydrogenase family)
LNHFLAGILAVPHTITKDGFELQMAANFLGHFYLSHLLMPQLIAGGENSNFNSRIVNVSSCAHFVGKINYDDFNCLKYYNEGMAYADSKLAQILFTNELNRICKENNWKVQVNSCHPGIVDTGKALKKKFIIFDKIN